MKDVQTVLVVNTPSASASSMTPVLITKNVEIGNERWKPATTIVDESVKNIPAGELPQSFIASDGNIYYFPPEMVTNGYQPTTRIIEPMQNGTVNGQESQLFPQQLSGPELVNHSIQNVQNVNVQNVQNDNVSNDMPSDELKRLIQLQFEYYFCRENLANDSYLVSQMDSDQYVYISTVAKFNQVRKLTSDMNLIVEALKESPYVQLDETAQKVRANMKRCIVILREIPESTPIDELKAIFCHPNCPKWVSFEFAHNDSWYITFDGEEDAKRAYRYLHEEVKHFRGRPLMARIKAKTLLSRTVYLPKNANTPSSVTVTCTSPSISTTQFTTTQQYTTAQPINTFAVPPNAVFHQPQSFPFYATTPVNGSPVIPGTWIRPRPTTFFIQQDIHPNFNNFNKHNAENIQFLSNKGRVWNRNNFNKNPKIPLQQRNGILDNDERQMLSSLRRNQNSNNMPDGNNTFPASKKDDDRYMRVGGNLKKEFRTNVEEGPRFQRLRERRHKEDAVVKSPENGGHKILPNNDLTLDLAIENFPALPVPNSPNENENKTASSLKELASSALQRVQEPCSTPSEMLNKSSDKCESSCEEQSLEALLSDSLMNTCINKTSACSSSIQSQIPKISYAQMAQKPNKQSSVSSLPQENFDNDDKCFTELPNTEITKNNNEQANKCKNDSANKNNSRPAKAQRKTSKGSPKAQRASQTNLPEVNVDNSVDCQLGNDALTAQKETYASKFGKVSSNTKTSTCTNTANTTWANSQSKGPLKNLPSPKPLMSQVIKPPSNESELHHQQQQQQIQDMSQKMSVTNAAVHKTVSKDLEKKVEDSTPVEEETKTEED